MKKAIKKAYGRAYEKYESKIGTTGYIEPYLQKIIEAEFNIKIDIEALQNNNGWTITDNLPEYNCYLWVYPSLKIEKYDPRTDKYFFERKYTHFKIIDEPKKPLY